MYFNGSSCYMSLSDLTLPFTYYMYSWIRPLKSGTIYSSSAIHDGEVQYSTHWGIRGNDLEFEHKELGGYWKTSSGDVEMDLWAFVEMRVDWGQYEGYND